MQIQITKKYYSETKKYTKIVDEENVCMYKYTFTHET